MNRNAIFASLVALTAFASPAQAANSATITTDLNLRAGPSTQYPVVTTIPGSSSVRIYGCNSSASWCDVSYSGHRGWASANYITVSSGGTAVIVTPAAFRAVGLPVVTYNQVYWNTHYKSYSWYGSGPNYYSRSRAGCVGSACGARQTATGAYGGSAARSGGCYNGKCAGTKRVTGPAGRTYRKSGGCNANTGNCRIRRSYRR
ncbi:MAG: SH3 domain-containing protein [Pseudomonadota bacterium]